MKDEHQVKGSITVVDEDPKEVPDSVYDPPEALTRVPPTLPPAQAMSLQQMAQLKPQMIAAFITAQKDAAVAVKKACFSLTEPEEWVLNRDKEGNVTGLIKSAGATRVARMLLGLEITNLRDDLGNAVSSVQVAEDGGVEYAYIVGDVTVGIFGDLRIEGLRAERRSDEEFIGRTKNQGDLRSSAFTLLTTKAVREILGWKSVPERILKDMKLDTTKCTKGHGFGSSSARQQAAETGEDAGRLEKDAKHLWERMLQEANGDEQVAHEILANCSGFTITDDGKEKTISARDWQHLVRKGTDKWLNSTKGKFEKVCTGGGEE